MEHLCLGLFISVNVLLQVTLVTLGGSFIMMLTFTSLRDTKIHLGIDVYFGTLLELIHVKILPLHACVRARVCVLRMKKVDERSLRFLIGFQL